ncbi:MAG: methyltransferase domain-containing protein [Verrucomicrobiota bacterium]|nr:methyltransferase domain-containing protein [Verrucomicrobiota bacterium]
MTKNRDETDSYWSEMRQDMASKYQYYVYEKAYKVAKKYNAKKILDIGCGFPYKIKHFFGKDESFEITLIDQPENEKIILDFFPNASFISLNLDLPLTPLTEKYDIIICADVIEHLCKPEYLLEFILSILADGDNSFAFISTPERTRLYGEGILSSGHPEHVREWALTEFIGFVSNNAFRVIDFSLLPTKRLPFFEEKVYYSCANKIQRNCWQESIMLQCKKVNKE